jgi:hypothetical protein
VRGRSPFTDLSAHGIGAILPAMFYLDLFRALQEEGVKYVVVGGLAINLHGVERATMDVDLVLAMDEANLRRFLGAARRLDLKPALPVSLEALCDAKQLDTWAKEKHLIAFSLQAASPVLPTVDIIVRPAVPFATMYRNRIEKDIAGVRFHLASIEDLIALKTGTGRKQDASDIEALRIVARVTRKDG